VYKDFKQWKEIRFQVLQEKVNKREVLRETGVHWMTLERVLQLSEPPGYRVKQERLKPKFGVKK
jgi:hypothetical protein